MKFARSLYVGDIAAVDKDTIIRGLKKNKFRLGLYLITLSESQSDLLEIIPAIILSNNLYIKSHPYKDLKIVGIAMSKKEALEVVRRLITDVYDRTGGFDVKNFFTFY